MTYYNSKRTRNLERNNEESEDDGSRYVQDHEFQEEEVQNLPVESKKLMLACIKFFNQQLTNKMQLWFDNESLRELVIANSELILSVFKNRLLKD
jgi:hypothetical protein